MIGEIKKLHNQMENLNKVLKERSKFKKTSFKILKL